MEMIFDGVKLMVIGMLTVFTFLLIMVFCMSLMSKILIPIAAKLEKNTAARKPAASDDDALCAVAAAAAFHENSK